MRTARSIIITQVELYQLKLIKNVYDFTIENTGKTMTYMPTNAIKVNTIGKQKCTWNAFTRMPGSVHFNLFECRENSIPINTQISPHKHCTHPKWLVPLIRHVLPPTVRFGSFSNITIMPTMKNSLKCAITEAVDQKTYDTNKACALCAHGNRVMHME